MHRIREPLFAAEADPVSIILVLNKESMLLDPIDWPSLKSDLSNWAAARPGTLLISEHTNNRSGNVRPTAQTTTVRAATVE